ncbi:hypothetical protein MJM99_29150, partial [Salmonella enterica subsp. enterica serovar Kentucky]|nr:hypothetical protein [Salmonella enterica subsp. enterica serovar Kentucky]
MLKRKKIKPITLGDVTIIDDGKLRKAITAASLGNAMEWFDFGDILGILLLNISAFGLPKAAYLNPAWYGAIVPEDAWSWAILDIV